MVSWVVGFSMIPWIPKCLQDSHRTCRYRNCAMQMGSYHGSNVILQHTGPFCKPVQRVWTVEGQDGLMVMNQRPMGSFLMALALVGRWF